MESLLLQRLRLPQGRQSWELVDLSLWNLDGRLLAYVILFQAVNVILLELLRPSTGLEPMWFDGAYCRPSP